MWFIFPQIQGLGSSDMAKRYAIESLQEANAYLHHPVLGPRLSECCKAILTIGSHSATDIFGRPDDAKLKSSMTLFILAAGTDSIFYKVLAKYFGGQMDARTIEAVAESA